MPSRHVRYQPAQPGTADVREPGALARRFAAIREELHVPGEFPAEVLAQAQRVVTGFQEPEQDLSDLPFFTIDPPGSMDLDQAMHLGRDGEGYRVQYAIADLPAFVQPDGPIDQEAWRRGQTIYLPDARVPLHPPVLSEGAASLLPGERRPAFVWDIVLDGAGEVRSARVDRAWVRSQERLDYAGVQEQIDAGRADVRIGLLHEIGERRSALEASRGGASLPMPEQEVVHVADGRYVLEFRPPRPAEDWNAQISLLTGMVAASMMLDAGVGILRTMPAPAKEAVRRFRRQARAMGVSWPDDQRYGDFLRGLDRTTPRHLALIHEATSLFRGAGYTVFDGSEPALREHAAVAAPYAHVTAPLRRLVDRYGLALCEAVSHDREVPSWVRDRMAELPETMAQSDRRASAVERACTDAVEAAMLRQRIGEVLPGSVIDVTQRGMPVVQIAEPAVVSPARGDGKPGAEVSVRVDGADVAAGRVHLQLV